MSLSTNVANAVTRIATEIKAIRTMVNGNQATLSGLTTTNKTNLVAALNEVRAALIAQINDAAPSTTTTYSSTKTVAVVNDAIAALVNSSPALLDTLDELAQALGDDPQFATTMSNALALRVRVDAAQTFTDPQKAQGRSNIGAASAADVGDTTTNFVTIFETGLA